VNNAIAAAIAAIPPPVTALNVLSTWLTEDVSFTDATKDITSLDLTEGTWLLIAPVVTWDNVATVAAWSTWLSSLSATQTGGYAAAPLMGGAAAGGEEMAQGIVVAPNVVIPEGGATVYLSIYGSAACTVKATTEYVTEPCTGIIAIQTG
jgi:hypothetical protein